MLEQYGSGAFISIVYTVGSALSLVLVCMAPRLIARVGNVRLSLGVLLVAATLLFMLGSSHSALVMIPAFIMYFSLNSLMLYAFDVFVEHYSRKHAIGNIRGTYMTLNNVGWVFMPIVVGAITSRFGFGIAYVIAAIMVLITGAILSLNEHHYRDKHYVKENMLQALRQVRSIPLIKQITTINFALQLFYVWMVLYSPLYLMNVVGYDWRTIGILFTIMLIPFVIFPSLIGRMGDRIGEKKFIILGFIICAGATLSFGMVRHGSIALYALILFLTRTGASIVEVASESFFFKQISDKETSIISIYRNMAPLAYVVGSMAAALIIGISSYTTLFFLLGLILIGAAWYTFRLNKT